MSFFDKLFNRKGPELNKKIVRGDTPGGVLGPGVRCIYTGQPADSVDHFIPLSSGLAISNTRINFVPCTKEYNKKKGDRWPTAQESEAYFRYWEGQLETVRDSLKIAKQITSNGHGFHNNGQARTEPYKPNKYRGKRRRR
jgi:hypothetical protein